MNNIREYLDNLWRWAAGVPDARRPGYCQDDKTIKKCLAPFIEKMVLRLVLGSLRYGPISAPGKPKYDRIGSMVRRLEKYQHTGNLEHLVDVANLAFLEFVESVHPKKHFYAEDDSEHTQALK